MSIIIAGPTSVSEGSTTQYVCSGNYSDGTSVIVSPSWSENSSYAVTIVNDNPALPLMLSSILIEGPTAIPEETSQQYLCRANWSDGSHTYVSPVWSDNSAYATITSAGLLRVGNVESDQKVVITDIYGGKADTHSVTIQYVP